MSFIKFIPNKTEKIEYKLGTVYLEKGICYITHESFVSNLVGNKEFLKLNHYTIDKNANNKKILFIRTMGCGDMLFLSSAIKLIKFQYPQSNIAFACVPEQMDFANLIDGIDEVYPLPLLENIFNKYDYHFEISEILYKEENLNKNIYDLILSHLGLSETEINNMSKLDKKPVIKSKYIPDNLQPYVREYNDKNIIKIENHTIGIHPFANDPIRQYNLYLVIPLILKLQELGCKIILFGTSKEINVYRGKIPPNIILADGNIESTINLMTKCHTIIAVDSLFAHLCQSIGIYSILLYGPFDPITRVKYYSNATILDTSPDCRCNLHGVGYCPKAIGTSPCMNIDIDIIISALLNENIEKPKEFKTQISNYGAV